MRGSKVKLCSPRPKLYCYFQENRLETFFEIVRPEGEGEQIGREEDYQ